jgi:hypothetical protein
MRLHVVNIPDDPAQLPAWLEQQLVGESLGELVAELSVVHAAPAAGATSLSEVLGNRRRALLASGLAVLPASALKHLLQRPRLLLDLQELVLVEGGAYWQGLGAAAPAPGGVLERGRERLSDFLAAEERPRPARWLLSLRGGEGAWHRRPWFVSLATAAALLLAFGLYTALVPPRPAAETAWGWNRPGALAEDVPADVYLNRLADAAEDWFGKQPDEPVELAKRIEGFRAGCSVLIFAPHRPLSPADRQWLVEKCRAWAANLDDHLRALEALKAEDDPAPVRAAADLTVRSLITRLRERAKEAAAA